MKRKSITLAILGAASLEPKSETELAERAGCNSRGIAASMRRMGWLRPVSGTGVKANPYRYVLTRDGEDALDEAFST